MGQFLQFLADNALWTLYLTGEHLFLVGISIGIAVAVGIPLGMTAFRVPLLRGPILGTTGIMQTFPSLAMLALLAILFEAIGKWPAITALALYALLPITQNTLTGLQNVPEDVVQAGRGIGMTDRQQLWMVRMPLALPVIIAGIRTAAVIGVGIATLSALIGAGGLGKPIIRGIRMADWRLQVLGGVPAIFLALVVYLVIGASEWALRTRRPTGRVPPGLFRPLRWGVGLLPVVVVLAGIGLFLSGPLAQAGGGGDDGTVPSGWVRLGEPGTVVIGYKSFTESQILAEIMAQTFEANTRLDATTRLLGGTKANHQALVNANIDLYPEYTGTGLAAILKTNKKYSSSYQTYKFVSKRYREEFGLVWLPTFGFNNTYVITVRKEQAKKRGWETISDLRAVDEKLTAGFTSEFMEREDGYPGLKQTYGLEFGELREMSPSLMYQALRNGTVDVISAYATNGKIEAFNLYRLEDDKNLFPPYDAAPLIRGETLDAHPEIRTALSPLFGEIDNETMTRLNFRTADEKIAPEKVARQFLRKRGLVE